MDSHKATKLFNDFSTVKKLTENEKEIDVRLIIKAMSQYNRSDLCLLRDCIDFVLIYDQCK